MFVKKEYMKIWEVRISPSCRTIVPTHSRLVTTKDCPLCAGTRWTLDLGVPDGPPTLGAGTDVLQAHSVPLPGFHPLFPTQAGEGQQLSLVGEEGQVSGIQGAT